MPSKITRVVDEKARENLMQRLNDTYAVVRVNGATKILTETVDEDNQPTHVLSSRKDLVEFTADELVDDTSGIKMNVIAWWMKQTDKRKCNGVTFDCSTSDKVTKAGYYNTYQGFVYESVKGYKHLKYLQLIREVICSNDDGMYKYLINYMAHSVQKPQVLPKEALAIVGGQGTGKSAFVSVWGSLFGAHFTDTVDISDITGQFNTLAVEKIIVNADESTWGGDKVSEGKIKKFISQPTLRAEKKYLDAGSVKNVTRLILTSNSHYLIHVDNDDRRALIFECSDKFKRNLEFFDSMMDDLRDGGYENLMHFLKNWCIKDFKPMELPERKQGFATVYESMSPLDKWIYDALDNNEFHLPSSTKRIDSKISYPDLMTAWEMHIKHFTYKTTITIGMLSKAWRALGCAKKSQGSVSYLYFNGLQEMRKQFQSQYTSTIFNWQEI